MRESAHKRTKIQWLLAYLLLLVIASCFLCNVINVSAEEIHETEANSNTTMTAKISEDGKSVDVNLKNVTAEKENLRLAVWSQANGQDDLRWIVADGSHPNYYKKISLGIFKEYGMYVVHAYGFDPAGSNSFRGGTTFEIKKPKAEGIISSSPEDGKFQITIPQLVSNSGISQVRVAVWSASNQSNLRWYTATKAKEQDYSTTVYLSNHKNMAGIYNAHVYVTDGNGITSFLAGIKQNVELSAKTVEGIVSADEKSIQVVAAGISNPEILDHVRIAVWSESGGQDDLRWYDSVKQNNQFISEIVVKNHKSTGKYFLHAYAFDKAGQAVYLKSSTVTINKPSAKIEINKDELQNGIFTIQIKDIDSPSGINKVSIPTWSQDNQNDLVNYAGSLKNGNYEAAVNLEKHKYNTGIYHSHIYVTDGNGFTSCIAAIDIPVTIETGNVTAKLVQDESQVNIVLEGLNAAGSDRGVRFAVWSESNGQDDLKWLDGSKSGLTYQTTEKIAGHNSIGNYYVHAYLIQKSGNMKYLKGTSFQVHSAKASVDVEITKDGSTQAVVSDIVSAAGVKEIRIAAWRNQNQNDLYWYTASSDKNGKYLANIDIARHSYHTGTYNIHAYLICNNGTTSFLGGKKKEIKPYYGSYYVGNASDNLESYEITMEKTASYLKAVQFGVWSEAGGQDDFVWYSGIYESKNNYYHADVDILKHRTYGKYQVHAYGKLANGQLVYIGQTEFTVSNLPANMITFAGDDFGTVQAGILINQQSYQLQKVRFAAWCDEDQGDICWYDGVKQNDGSYTAALFTPNHKNHYGIFKIHVYGQDAAGGMHYIAGEEHNIKAPGTVNVDSCIASTGGTVTVSAHTSGNGTREYGLFYVGMHDTIIAKDRQPAAVVSAGDRISITAPVNKDTASSLHNRRLVVGLKTSGGYLMVSSGNYISNPEVLAQYTYAFPTTSSKKGLQINSDLMSDVEELGVNHAVINFPLNSIISNTPTDTAFAYHGTNYYFNTGYLNRMDQHTSELAAKGVVMTAVILLQSDNEHLSLIVPSGRTGGHLFYALNTEEESAIQQLEATFTYLAMRYADSNHKVVNWVLGNELSNPSDYYWCGNVSFDTYMKYYTDAFCMLSSCVRGVYNNARIYTSLDQCWTYERKNCYTGKKFLTAFANILSQRGVAWNLAFHPYPCPLTNANFWSYNGIVQNSWDSPVITMKNLDSLTNYLKTIYGSGVRVILSETGFTSVSSGVKNEPLQAAAIAYGYYLAEFNDMVDSFVVHRHVDHQVEMEQGLYLGLWANETGAVEMASRKKMAWTVFKYMDTSQSLQYTNFALPIIGASSWQQIVPGFNPGRFQ